MDLTKLSVQELNKLIEDAKTELASREDEKIIYLTEFRRGNWYNQNRLLCFFWNLVK